MVRWSVRNEAIKSNGSLDTRRNAKAKGELMTGWSDYALDRFMAPKLSKLTVCGAEELSEPIVLLPPFILNSILVVKFDEAFRINAFNLIRRVEQAHYEYEHGRANLVEYVSTARDVISPYFRALAHFEQSVALIYQSACFGARITGLKKPFKKGTGSVYERMFRIYVSSRHMDELFLKRHMPAEATSLVWITNEGLECVDAAVNFAELRETIVAHCEIARQIGQELPKRVQQTRGSQ